MRPCKQTKCIFLMTKQGCRKCGDCSAPSFVIADDCIRCFSCENVPDSCRWDDDKPETDLKEKNKPIEIDIKTQ